jgi:LPS-assembly lipoprotein
MSSFDRRYVLAGLATLAGCGFEPVYQQGGSADGLRGAILIDDPKDRDEFNLVDRLENRFGRPQSPVFGLQVDMSISEEGLAISGSNDITRYNVLGDATFVMTRLSTGAVVHEGRVNTFTAYSASQQPVATLSAERDARVRIVDALADKIAAQVLLHSSDIQS